MAEVKVVSENQLATIKDYIESIKYGSVNIIIQDGKIVQIDKSEKIRL
ncbi:MAG: YezD family protein [Pseudobutyrivibrio sp.]|nr:YezD family protein [Pseudobutyrivibrio sp.]MBP5325000.1 YezD family protein [Pseudobutyrivibrio sp.]MBP5598530.1 YezD family protein [Pseudobutyrivibrio sp.]MBQ3774113.1 YezD family protein [Pseudobutyrivibrio sp.]MBQ7470480.1 YezD family protein [Pseudobutyrivibrio sp.]MBR5649386.1 YezD family protein [Pseudobutyrivibrio sp.]